MHPSLAPSQSIKEAFAHSPIQSHGQFPQRPPSYRVHRGTSLSGDCSVSCMTAHICEAGLGLSWLKLSLTVETLLLLMAQGGSGSLGSKCKILTLNSYLFYPLILLPGSKHDTDPRSQWSVTWAGTEPRAPESQSRGLQVPRPSPFGMDRQALLTDQVDGLGVLVRAGRAELLDGKRWHFLLSPPFPLAPFCPRNLLTEYSSCQHLGVISIWPPGSPLPGNRQECGGFRYIERMSGM